MTKIIKEVISIRDEKYNKIQEEVYHDESNPNYLHREDGPAIIEHTREGDVEYFFLFNECFSRSDYYKIMKDKALRTRIRIRAFRRRLPLWTRGLNVWHVCRRYLASWMRSLTGYFTKI